MLPLPRWIPRGWPVDELLGVRERGFMFILMKLWKFSADFNGCHWNPHSGGELADQDKDWVGMLGASSLELVICTQNWTQKQTGTIDSWDDFLFEDGIQSHLSPLFVFQPSSYSEPDIFFFFFQSAAKISEKSLACLKWSMAISSEWKASGVEEESLGAKPTTWELVEKLPVDRLAWAHSGWTVWPRAKVWWKEESQSPWAGCPGVTILPNWQDTWLWKDSVPCFADWGNEMLWIKCFLPNAPLLPSSHFSKMNFSEAWSF